MKGADYQLVTTPGGASVYSVADQETFHPVAGPEAEALALYVHQLRLIERGHAAARRGNEFVIWDVGLGAGGNVCTVLRAMRETGARLRVVSFERTLAPLEFALQHAAELPFLRDFDATLRVLLTQGAVSLAAVGLTGEWELHVGDFPTLVRDPRGQLPRPDAVLFDAFSPAKNPAMWSLPVFQAIRSRVGTEGRGELSTYSRATLVRTALLLAGWYVGRGDAIAGKEETTVAATHRADLRAPLGVDFLRRVDVSAAAEPLQSGEYFRGRITPEHRQRLWQHPQFHGNGGLGE